MLVENVQIPMEKLPQGKLVPNSSFKGTYFFVKIEMKTSTKQVGTTIALVHSAFYKYTKTCLDSVSYLLWRVSLWPRFNHQP
jgi:hypothetical protein